MQIPKPAATVMVFRPFQNQIELLMLKRSRKAGFFPNAWVFPGGRVDSADSSARFIGAVPGLEQPEFAIAAIRECYEEAGVWLGRGVPPEGFRDRLNARNATLNDAPELVADLDRMAQWSWWVTPIAEPKRYDTRFFLTCLNPEESSVASPDQSETVDHVWIRPQAAVEGHESGDMFMAPPTYLTLRELCRFSNLTELWTHARRRETRMIQPIHRKSSKSFEILLPGHPDHDVESQILEATSVHLSGRRWEICTPSPSPAL